MNKNDFLLKSYITIQGFTSINFYKADNNFYK